MAKQVERRLAAVPDMDVVGYNRGMATDGSGSLSVERAWKRPCLLLFAALCLTACGRPEILDTTEAPWLPAASRDFTLAIDRPFLTSVDAVRLYYTRHYWPGAEKAHAADVGTDGAIPDRWKASGADLATAPDSHHLFYQWQVDYTRPFGLGNGTVLSEVLSFVIGCTPEMTETQLQAMQQQVVATHDTPDPFRENTYPFLPHGFVSIENTGVGFAFAGGAALGQFPGYPTSLDAPAPAIVLYRPRPQKAGDETDAQYLSAVTDETGNDSPYELIGWAYGAGYDPSNWPRIGCIPSSEWFVHEAGFHRANGAMNLYPTSEEIPGQTTVGGALPPPDAPQSADATFWHPRAWDLHVWLVEGSNTPVIQIFSPEPVPGIDASGLFFHPEIFQ